MVATQSGTPGGVAPAVPFHGDSFANISIIFWSLLAMSIGFIYYYGIFSRQCFQSLLIVITPCRSIHSFDLERFAWVQAQLCHLW